MLAAILALLLSFTFWPSSERDSAQAATQPCGPNDANRATMTTSRGVTLRPCLSKVNLKLDIPRTQTSTLGCGFLFLGPCFAQKWTIAGVQRSGLQTVKYADGTTEQLYRLTFSQFNIVRDSTLSTTNGNGYNLTVKPDAAATIGGTSGGNVIYTDLWVTPESLIWLNFLIFDCGTATRVDNGLLGVTSLIPVSSPGCGMDLNIRYQVSTSAAANGAISGVYSVQLPNTSIGVS